MKSMETKHKVTISIRVNDELFMPFDIKPAKGYEDFNKYQWCNDIVVSLSKRFEDDFCNNSDIDEEEKKLFAELPKMTAKKVAYTVLHIAQNIKSDNLIDDIKPYLLNVWCSMGFLLHDESIDIHKNLYLTWVFYLIQERATFQHPKDKEELLSFIRLLPEYAQNSDGTDFYDLFDVYKKWKDLFPFEMKSYFDDLDNTIDSKIPLFDNFGNQYVSRIISKSELVKWLCDLTKELLNKVDEQLRYEKIDDIIDHQRKINGRILRTKTAKLTKKFEVNELPYVELLEKWLEAHREYFKETTPLLALLPPQQIETKTDKLKTKLIKYGFEELPKVKELTGEKKGKLYSLICSNEMPYCIAMFDFLGFIKHLKKEHFNTAYKLNIEIAKLLNPSSNNGRSVKGNISTLSENTKENKERYTAHTYKESVKNDYENLK